MSKKDFKKYLDSIESNSEESKIDWNKEKEEWLEHLDILYDHVKGYLSGLDDVNIQMDESNKKIEEQWIGEYEAKMLFLNIKGKKVFFEPIGTNIIAAKGRVDMKGDKGTVKFLLVDKNATEPKIVSTIHVSGEDEGMNKDIISNRTIEWIWKIATIPPKIRYEELNEKSFFKALMEVING